jgi:hypothetical protein
MLADDGNADASAYQTAFQALGAFNCAPARCERRRELRSPLRSYQWIAPRSGNRMPHPVQFEQYQCYDISASGFSFLSPTRPGFRSLVVALVALPEVIYLAADVVHCTDVYAYPSGAVEPAAARSRFHDVDDGTPMYLVGCRFDRRLSDELFQQSQPG